MDLLKVKREIIRILLDLNSNAWETTHLVFAFPPYINKGWTGSQLFKDSNDNKIRLSIFGDEIFNHVLYEYIIKVKSQGKENQIIFTGDRDKIYDAKIELGFDQMVEDNFQNNLPKSFKGKMIPWWNNPEEIKGLE